jgi:predicted thioredoxin/glutaredoxin
MSNPQIFTAEAAEAVASSVGGYQALGIFLHVVSQCTKNPKFHEYVSKKGLLPLMEQIDVIRRKDEDPKEALMALHLQVSDADMIVIRAIVFKTIEACCIGFISKQLEKNTFPDVLTYVLRTMVDTGHYWSVVQHSMAEFVIKCDDKPIKCTFFEQKMLELVTSSE